MTEPSRVVHLSTVHHPLDSRIYLKEVRSLARAGFDVWLIARGEGVTHLEEGHFRPLRNGRGRIDRLARQWASSREIRRLRPRLLHVHDPELLPLARYLKSRLGLLVIYDKHEDHSERPGLEGSLLRHFEQRAYRWLDHVLLAEESYERLLAGVDVPRTTILNYALPQPEHDSEHGKAGLHPVRIVYTGTVSRGRGLFHLLEVARLARTRNADIRVTIAGICNYAGQRREAERLIQKNHLQEVVSLVGWDRYASTSELDRARASAHLGTMLAEPEPNYVVSIPTKFYEYMQAGLPMVVSDFPLWRDFIERNGCGLVVDSGDPRQSLETILTLVRESRFERMREACRAHARQYRWDVMEARLLGVYERLLSGRT